MYGGDGDVVKLRGHMRVEDSSHKFTEKRFFELDLREKRLNIYYDTPEVGISLSS